MLNGANLNIINQLLTSIALVTVLSQNLAADEYNINVIDQHQNPVSDAVVSFMSTDTNPISPNIAVMDQVEQQFSPKVLVIKKNQQVVFPNSDNTRHHVYSFSPAKPFEIKLYSGTPNIPVTFDKPGVIILGCNIHDDMVAYIYVKQKEITALTNKYGVATLKQVPNSIASLWHFDIKTNDDNNSYQLKKINEHNWSIQIQLIQRLPKKSNTFKARYK